MQKHETTHYYTSCTNVSTRSIRDLNLSPETITLPEEKIGKALPDADMYRGFLAKTPEIQAIEAKYKMGL